MDDAPAAELPRGKAELLDRVQRSRSALEELLAWLSEARLLAAGADGGWSVQDHLAHIAAWEQIVLGGLAGRPEHEVYGVEQSALATLDTDARNKARPLSEVREEFARSHNQVLATLPALAEAELFRPFAADDPRPRMQKIAGDTYVHYDEHREWIAALLAGAPRAL